MRYLATLRALAVLAAAAATPASAGTYASLYAFRGGLDGSYPNAGLVRAGGELFGVTSGSAGTFFSFDPKSGAEKPLYQFTDGQPGATLIDVGGTLYGTITEGGAYGWGAVFALNPKTGAEQTVYSFQDRADGYFPETSLLNVGGILYGTTIGGGMYSQGTVFALNPSTGIKQIVYSFAGGNADGEDPQSELINVNGTLYGTTRAGGPGFGTVYSIDPGTGTEKIVYFFGNGSDGGEPYAGLVNVSGILYGATYRGGAGCDGGCGVIYALDPATGTETVMHTFAGGTDGAQPRSTPLLAGHILYGTTEAGGAACHANGGCGTLYSVDLSTGKEKTLYAFRGGKDGADPWDTPVMVGGTLFATTYAGGGNACAAVSPPGNPGENPGCGTLFSYTP
jgi:uncharacterized repeat protein (TIGR03803 family)